ncbi:hypothetical protein C5S35_14550 [Candidatus Methanophagaceae archaeon]|nr:hypothetical protein C5S35_14550 [Methanophagales archaeon]
MFAKKKIVASVAVLLAILLVGTVIASTIPVSAPTKDMPGEYRVAGRPDVSIEERVVKGEGIAGTSVKGYYIMRGDGTETRGPPKVPIPVQPKVPDEPVEYTQLRISPSYEWLEMEPGDKRMFTVEVKHDENKSVLTQVFIESPPYSEYIIGDNWVTVEPESAEIAVAEVQEYNVTVEIPTDAELGYYNAQIVFTNDTWPMPYPKMFPAYVNTCELSINVWRPPVVFFWPRHISDRVKAGKSYEYEILLENIGDTAIAINPEIEGDEERFIVIPSPYGYKEDRMPKEWLKIESPASVQANSTATVTVTVDVPEDAYGWCDTKLNLNIDDPSITDEIVYMNLEVWKPPTTPYCDNFAVEQGAAFSVMVTTSQHEYDRYGGTEEEEPSFTTVLLDPYGENVAQESVKTVKKRAVGVGYMPWDVPGDATSEDPYHVMFTEYSKTYEVTNATGGTWTLEILPIDVQDFEYTIEIGK